MARWTVPPAALAAIGSFAAHEADSVAAAEGAYLGRLAAAALVAVAMLAPAPAAELGLGAALATTAAWALPAGPGRGAAVMALLGAALAIATGRRLRQLQRQLVPDGGSGDTGPGGRSSGFTGDRALLPPALALCFGSQVLLRGELLFAPGRSPRAWMALVALPVVAGCALAVLWRRHGVPALAAAAAAAVLAPGWTVATTLAMVALAGGTCLPRGEAVPPPKRGSWQRWLRPAGCAIALALPIAWEPRSGWAMTLAGLALWRPRLATLVALPLAAVARGASVAGLALPGALASHGSWREGAAAVAWLLMLVPATVPAALLTWVRRAAKAPPVLPPTEEDSGGERRRQGRYEGDPAAVLLIAAAVIAFAAPWLPNRSVLAAPLALAALALPAAGAAAGLTALWSSALLLGTALLASYPWLRSDPLTDALALLGTGPGPRPAAAIGAAALVLIGAVPRHAAPLSVRAGRVAAAAAGAALFCTLAGPRLAFPAAALLDGGDAVLLDRSHPTWGADLDLGQVRSVVLQTSLVHAADLAAGTPVARVRLLGTGFAPVELRLRAGRDTAEWAARRPDLAATARLVSPPPWLAWVAGDFFGQRYRARLRLPPGPTSFARVEIDLAAGLPSASGLALYQVELEP